MSSSKKLTSVASVYLSEAPPILGFCLGWSSNFSCSESGQIQGVKLLQNMVSKRDSIPTTPFQAHTVSIYCTLTQGGGGIEPERRLEWQQFTKLGQKLKLQVLVETTICTLYSTTYLWKRVLCSSLRWPLWLAWCCHAAHDLDSKNQPKKVYTCKNLS